MFCPECNAEYKEGITVCADCGATLVDKEPFEEPLEEVEWVKLRSVDRVFREMIAEVFDKEGIPCYSKGDRLSSTLGMTTSGALGGFVDFYVPKTFEEQAKEIIKEMVGE